MAIIAQTQILFNNSIDNFEANLVSYFESLSDDVTVTNDTTNHVITFDINGCGSFVISRDDGTYHYLDVIINGVTTRLLNSNKLPSSKYGWEVYSVIDTNLFLIWFSVPSNTQYASGSLKNLLNNANSYVSGLMFAVIPDANGNTYVGYEGFRSLSSSNNDIFKNCTFEKCGDASVNGITMVDIFDYKSKIGYIDFVFGSTFCSGNTRAFKSPIIANSSTVVAGESYSLSSGSYFSVNKYALLSIDN